MPLILASASPRRRELLERVGIAIEVLPAGVDETPHDGEAPEAYVARIAAAKASAIATQHPGRWVLAADTTVTIDGAILGKAETAAEAAAMLRQLSGRTHQVITGFAIAGTRAIIETVTSDVDVIALDEAAIADYVASDEWRGKAGAYAIQGIAAAFVRGVRGSVTNIIGLPLVEVLEALRALGAPSARLAAGVPS
ncbi:MAG TPA: nucleoside triphosphate pyrophosphatase [Kofleriaceae bacterium]|nr:nucleoside triphosphate pyrophosphatase [Kofleriaceae bacterium]